MKKHNSKLSPSIIDVPVGEWLLVHKLWYNWSCGWLKCIRDDILERYHQVLSLRDRLGFDMKT